MCVIYAFSRNTTFFSKSGTWVIYFGLFNVLFLMTMIMTTYIYELFNVKSRAKVNCSMLIVTIMPRPNQKVVTLSRTFYEQLEAEAKSEGLSVPVLLRQAFDALGQGDTYLTIVQDGTFKHKGRFFVEVTKRGFRIIKYGCAVYRKPSPYMVERFIDSLLNLIPLDDPIRDKKARA